MTDPSADPKASKPVTASPLDLLASGLRLAATEWAGGGPPVVLVHGGGQTRHSWGPTGQRLAEANYHVVAYDQRGHGDSDWHPEKVYATEAFGEDAVAVATVVSDRCGQPVHWVGASLGGLAGLLAVDKQPDLFASLTLVDITARPAAKGVDRIIEFMVRDANDGFATLDEAADAVAAYQPHRKRPRSTAGLSKNLRQGEDGRWRWHWDPSFIEFRANHPGSSDHLYETTQRAAGNLRLPTLLVRGRESDLVTDAEVEVFRTQVPHAHYVNVKDAAHMVAGDMNDVFTAAVVDFIDDVAA